MNHKFKQETICVIGLGYIGLPTASILATHGFKVTGVEIKRDARANIQRGVPQIEEPGLQTLVGAAIKSGNLKITSKPKAADVFIICVPTPLIPSSKKADLNFVNKAARSIVHLIKPGNLVILESTIPPGTTEYKVASILRKSGYSIPSQIHLAHCPERVLPGNIMDELIANDRIIGGMNESSAKHAQAVYSKFVSGKIFLTSATVAEMAKLSENTFRDINIAFANELDGICNKLAVNTREVIKLANYHPRVNILQPGPGVGGHCIAVDPWFLAQDCPNESKLIRCARQTNDAKPDKVIARLNKMKSAMSITKINIACLGLAYKANTDDFRESPALNIVKKLLKRKDLNVFPVDPYGHKLKTIRTYPLREALEKAHIILILVAHKEFIDAKPQIKSAIERTQYHDIDTVGLFAAERAPSWYR
ncbi:nucleotide sugar dehydrogenase [Elusimicrobiota bacterium]